MPVTVVPSAKKTASKKSRVSRNRRQNENIEIRELASFIPMTTCPASSSLVTANSGNKPPSIAVLRLTSMFLKLHNFVKDISSIGSAIEHEFTNSAIGRMEEAIDGFLLILDKDANILYVSESIAGYVGLIQQDVIGQNLVDITHREFSTEIRDNLKPSLIVPSSVAEDCVISQFRQFCVRFVPNVSYSTSPSHLLVQVCGNLKVKLSPQTSMENGVMEVEEPLVIGFVGECHVIESVPSIVEISVPCSSFIVTRSLDMKKVISVEATVRDVIGYDPEILLDDRIDIMDFLHPSDQSILMKTRGQLMRSAHAVSPQFRFLTSSGDWVWMQVEATLRYKSGTAIPQFWELKIRALGQWRGRLKYIEQNELYSSKDIPSPTRDPEIAPKLAKYREVDGAKPIIDSLKSVRLPDNILEPVLHGRSLAMNEFSEAVVQFVQNSTLGDATIPQKQGSIVQREIGGNSSPSVSTNTDDTLALSSPHSSISDTGSTNLMSVGCQTSFTSHLSTPLSIQVDSSTVAGTSDMDNGMLQPLSSDSGDKVIEQQQKVSFIDPMMSNQYLPMDGSFSTGSLYNSAMTLTSAGQEPYCNQFLGVTHPGDDGYHSPVGAFSPFDSTATSSMNNAQSCNHSPQLETMQYSTTDSKPIPSQLSPHTPDNMNSTANSQILSNFNFVHSTSTPSTDSASSCMMSCIPDLSSMLHIQQHGSCPPINRSDNSQQSTIEEPNFVGFNSFPVGSTNSISQEQANTVTQTPDCATLTSLTQDPNSFCTQTYGHDELLLSTTDTGDIQDILEQFL